MATVLANRAASATKRTSVRRGRASRAAVKVQALGMFGGGEEGGAEAAPAPVLPPSPPGVCPPPVEPRLSEATFGFVRNAEVLNSRAAMIGFFSLLFVEAIAGKPLLEMIGIEVGNGIDIGF